jgi:hypothetical protein
VVKAQVVKVQEDFFDRILEASQQKNQWGLSASNGTSMINHLVLPCLVDLVIIDSFCRVPPTAIANAANLKLDDEFMLNELPQHGSLSKAEVHLQLLRALADDHAKECIILGCAEHASASSDSSPKSRSDDCPAASLEQIDRCSQVG